MVFLALLVSMGVTLGFLEFMIFLLLPLPGARLDLSNLVVLTSLLASGNKGGFIVAFLESLLLMPVTGNVTVFFYSVTGSILSCLTMIGAICWTMLRISSIGVSLIGASFRNLGQVNVACLIVLNRRIFACLPMFFLLGIFTGFFVGLGSNSTVDQMKRNNIAFRGQK